MHIAAAALNRLELRTIWLLFIVAVFGCHRKTDKEWDKEFFDGQVAAIQAGNRDSIDLYDVQGSDALLKSIAGLKGVRRVSVAQHNDITDVGIKEIAALPDLTYLTFYEIEITDKWLEFFQISSKLEELDLTPNQPPAFSVATVLSLPHLRKLHLDVHLDPRDPGAGDGEQWVDATLQGLREAKSLEKLTLTGNVFVERRLALVALQKEIPGCKITLLSGRNPRAQTIPLTDGQ